mmetsp:Transcript_61862/g.113134  ORF Transcript_61862/g.113134 Transcript_61862/m.113134 type:complete len:274 (+) Transcript_61862:63-884(+)
MAGARWQQRHCAASAERRPLPAVSRLTVLLRQTCGEFSRLDMQARRPASPGRWRAAEVGLWACLVALGTVGSSAIPEERNGALASGAAASLSSIAHQPRRLGDTEANIGVICGVSAYILLLLGGWLLFVFMYNKRYPFEPAKADAKAPAPAPAPAQDAAPEAKPDVELEATTRTLSEPLPAIEEEVTSSEPLDTGLEAKCADLPRISTRGVRTWGRGEFAVVCTTNMGEVLSRNVEAASNKNSQDQVQETPVPEAGTSGCPTSWCSGTTIKRN